MYGNPVSVPVRLRYRVDNTSLYVVLMAPANSVTVVSIDTSRGNYLYTNATDYYAYFTKDDPHTAIVIQPGDDHHLSNYGLSGQISAETPENITPITPTTTTMTKTTTTTQSPTTTQTTTSTSIETTTTPLATVDSPAPPSTTRELSEESGVDTLLLLLAVGAVAFMSIYLVFRLLSKR